MVIKFLRTENGSVFLVSVIILTILSIIAMSAFRTTKIELQIAKNQKTYNTNLVQAEGAAMEAAQKLWNLSDIVSLETLSSSPIDGWIFFNPFNSTDPSGSDIINANFNAISTDCEGFNNTAVCYSADYIGVGSGDSLDMSSERSHTFALYGISTESGGKVVIEVGFKKRF